MGKFKIISHSIILATTPSLLVYPQGPVPQADFHVQTVHSRKLQKNFRKKERYHLVSYDEVLNLLEEIESGTNEYREKDLRRINRFMTYLAKEGVLPNSDNSHELSEDIKDLLEDEHDDHEFAFTFEEEGGYSIIPAVGNVQVDILLCKSKLSKKWKKSKKFIKKHKKEIIIGAVIVVATATVVVAVVATSSAGAAAAVAGAAGAAASSKSGKEEKSKPAQPAVSDSIHFDDTRNIVEATNETPTLKATINEHISSFREFVAEDIVIQSSDVHRDPSFREKARELSSMLAHETLEGISEIASVIPQLGQEIKDLGSKILPENVLPPSDNPFIGSPKENYENFIAKSHEAIDRAFSTEKAEQYTPEAKANDPMNDFTIGLVPPPGNFSRGLNVSKFKKIIEVGKETAVLAEELGFTAKEIAHLERAGSLDKIIADAVDRVYSNHAMLESCERFKYAKTYLESFSGKYMPESQIRQLIHEAGIRTSPRPKGIPKNFRVKLSDNGAGMKYVHPEHEHTYVRVMPGKPHSLNPSQQKPYVNHRINGQSIDKFGKKVPNHSPEAHIPIDEFTYRSNRLWISLI